MFEVSEYDGWSLVAAPSRLNVAAAPTLRSTIEAVVRDRHERVLVDLSDTSFMDSSGLGGLVGSLKLARQAGGDLRVFGVGPQVREVLRLTSLDRVFTPYPSAAEAVSDE